MDNIPEEETTQVSRFSEALTLVLVTVLLVFLFVKILFY